jgi:hypothetical protein
MDRKSIHEKIAELTELININNNRLFLHDDKIAQLEIDVLRKNVIELYEQINMLHINNLKNKDEVVLTSGNNDKIALDTFDVEVSEPIIQAKPPVKEENIIVDTPISDEKIEAIKEVINTIKEEKTAPPIEEKPIEIVVEKVMPPVEEIKVADLKPAEIVEEPTVVKPPQQALFHESSELKTTSSNPPKEKENKNLFEKYRSAKIDSIKKAISILKKYEYQSGLFKNDPKAYTDAIEMLDNSASGDIAISLLENSYRKQYEWGEKQENLVEELKELVYRRHS